MTESVEWVPDDYSESAAPELGPAETKVGYSDEPQHSGAVVAVHYGEPQQEIWVRSRSNIGNWYPLGSEYGCPRPWDDPRSSLEKLSWRGPDPRPGPGEVPRHPHWEDVLDALDTMTAQHGEFLTALMMRSVLDRLDAEKFMQVSNWDTGCEPMRWIPSVLTHQQGDPRT